MEAVCLKSIQKILLFTAFTSKHSTDIFSMELDKVVRKIKKTIRSSAHFSSNYNLFNQKIIVHICFMKTPSSNGFESNSSGKESVGNMRSYSKSP